MDVRRGDERDRTTDAPSHTVDPRSCRFTIAHVAKLEKPV